jgi:hypothetical protein
MMKKSVNHSKDKDTHLKQADKANVEVIRNLKVAEIKEALNRLEDVEKLSKRSSITAILKRIEQLEKDVHLLSRCANNLKNGIVTKKCINQSESIEAINKSVRCDFKKVFELKDEDFDVMFPKIKLGFKNQQDFVHDLLSLTRQLLYMDIFCVRILYE